MLEVTSVVKSFFFALLIVICMQVRIGSSTLETHAQEWIHTSSIALYLQEVADGATLMIHNAGHSVSDFVGKTFGHHAIGGAETQRAGRLNFSFKRSPAYEQTHKNSDE
jgi:hypothetical protein